MLEKARTRRPRHNSGYQRRILKYPCIIVERPHQMPGSAWIAEGVGDILEQLYDNRHGDNWGISTYDAVDDLYKCYADYDDLPEEWRDYIKAGGTFPAKEYSSASAMSVLSADDPEADDLDFALDYIGDDLSSLDILESSEEAAVWIGQSGHNKPYNAVERCRAELGWIEESDDE